MADRQAEIARKREQEATRSLEEKSRKLEKTPFLTRRDGWGSRYEDDDRKDSLGSWRKSTTTSDAKPSSEPWKPRK